MTRFLSDPIDLSQEPPFRLVDIDYEVEYAAIKAGIVARFQARGVDYDVQDLETDSAMILAEEFAYRKTVGLQQIDDAGKRLTLAYGYGAALDHIAATYYADIGVVRQPAPGITSPRPYALHPEDWESDDRFRDRIQRAPETRTPGMLRGYEYYALTAAPALTDAKAYDYSSGLCSPGQILLVVLGRDVDLTMTAAEIALQEPAQLDLVRNLILNQDYKLGSDEVIIRGATRVPVAVSAALGIKLGPDPALVTAGAAAGLAAYKTEIEAEIGRIYAESGAKHALYVGAVERVRLTSGNTDVSPGLDGVIRLAVGAIATETIGG